MHTTVTPEGGSPSTWIAYQPGVRNDHNSRGTPSARGRINIQRRRVRHVTPRQREILDLALRGLTDKEIAADLGVAVSTVRTHLERFYRENGLRNKTEAVAAWQHYRETEEQQRDEP